jgi:hypothetical protein
VSSATTVERVASAGFKVELIHCGKDRPGCRAGCSEEAILEQGTSMWSGAFQSAFIVPDITAKEE